jgi:EAL domain-containing protein (putative c-di-GMP-specific phosphodiesterase class I)
LPLNELLLFEFPNTELVLKCNEQQCCQHLQSLRERFREIKQNPRVSICVDNFASKMANFDLLKPLYFEGAFSNCVCSF